MSIADIIVIAVIAVILFFAIRSVIKKKGGCGCGCSNCSACGGGSTCTCGTTDKTPEKKK